MKNSRLFTHLCYISMLFFGVILGSNYLQAKPINALTVTATPTAETCNGNGSATITIDHTEAGAELQIVLFKKPDLTNPAPGTGIRNITATSSQVSEVFNGLAAGDYTVKVTQSVETTPGNTETNETTTEFKVIDKNVVYTITGIEESGSCGGAKVRINVSPSSSDLVYEMRDRNGNTLRRQTNNNIFEKVPKGDYRWAVINPCNTVVKDKSITTEGYTFSLQSIGGMFENNSFPLDRGVTSCNMRSFIPGEKKPLGVSDTDSEFIAMYPILIRVNATVNGNTTTHEFIKNGPKEDFSGDYQLPASETGTDRYDIELIDNCGEGVDDSVTYEVSGIDRHVLYGVHNVTSCGDKAIIKGMHYNLVYPITVKFVEYPTGFDPANYATLPGFTSGNYEATFDNFDDVPNYGDENNPVPPGNYKIQIIDSCGETINNYDYPLSVEGSTYMFVANQSPDIDNKTSINLKAARDVSTATISLVYVEMIKAPDGFTPLGDISHLLKDAYGLGDGRKELYLKDLPLGKYTFKLKNECGVEEIKEFEFLSSLPSLDDFTYTVEKELCGTFRINSSEPPEGTFVVLQKIDPLPLENVGGVGEDILGVHGGRYRLKVVWNIFDEESNRRGSITTKEKVIDEFTYYDFVLNDYYVFECPGGKVNLALDADGVEPFNYTITSKDGDTSFTKDNGSNPVFTDLDPGMYSVKVEDNCGNIINVTLDARSSKFPTIKPNNLCHDENGYLYLPGLDFLNIEWFKDGNPVSGITGIIQDQNYLRFETFDGALHQGVYTAHLTYTNAASCIDETLSFTVGDTSKPPRAGEDNEIEIELDDLGLSIDLFDYLADGTYDLHGTWEEITDSKLLVSNTWMAEHAKVGTYQFKYTVDGLCHSGTAESIITLNVLPSVCTQLPTAGTPKPSHVGITTLGRKDQNTSWVTGVNNGYLVLESKEKGFVITRTTASSINDAREGMIIWDTADQCVKLYNGSDWKCIEPSCNE